MIIELKRLSKAYNAGEMIKQVKDYAKDFYNKGKDILRKDIDSRKESDKPKHKTYLIPKANI